MSKTGSTIKVTIIDKMHAFFKYLLFKPLRRKFKAKTVRGYLARPAQYRFSPSLGRIGYQAKAEKIGIDQIQDIESQASISRVYVAPYEFYVAHLENVRIIGGSSVIYGNKRTAINDSLADTNFGHFVDMRNDQFLRLPQPGIVAAKIPRVSKTVERAIHLSGLFANQFGHWYAEFLPRLRHFEQLEDFASIPILVNSDMPVSHYELLNLFCDNQIIRVEQSECIRVNDLLVAPTITFCPPQYVLNHSVPFERQGAWSAEAMQYMRNKILAHFPEDTPQTRAIYLSRRNSTWGIVVNEREVEDCLQSLGFEIVLLEQHSFREQVSLLRSSHTIVGATGSALNLLMLAAPETDMILLSQSESHNWGGWAGPMRDIGFDPRFLLMNTGSNTEKHVPITVDVSRLRRILSQVSDKRIKT